MGNIVGKQFGVVASKDYNTALTESVKEGNQGKFYLTENGGKGFNDITATTDDSRNTLIVNGNKIQGVSTSDINKLNAITSDTAKIFKYKGSVDWFESLPNTPSDVNVGDVYNISNEFDMDGVSYPAHTNVVCIESVNGASSPIVKWDALGGTMEIGTSVGPSVNVISSNRVQLGYKTNNNIPISSFYIEVDTSNGLNVNKNGQIYLNAANAVQSNPVAGQLKFKCSTAPINEFSIYCGNGIDVNDGEGHTDPKLCLKLATVIGDSNDDSGKSGLCFNSYNALSLALATNVNSEINNNYIFALRTLGQEEATNGGLAIYGPNVAEWLRQNNQFKNYINSLIDAKLIVK